MRPLALFALALMATSLLASCGSNKPLPPSVTQVREQVAVQKTDFDSHTRFIGPGQDDRAAEYEVRLRSWLEPGDDEYVHQVYIKLFYVGSERGYRSVNFPGGGLAEAKVIDRIADCAGLSSSTAICSYEEHIGAYVDHKTLKKAARGSGLRLRVNARSGHETYVKLEPYYIKGYLAATEPYED
ncbi:MAG: hypothetical protein AAGH48_02815 [Pseudomonadota bacterium]